MHDMTFQYGGKHFMPVRKFEKKDGDFYQITRRLRLDVNSSKRGHMLRPNGALIPF